MTNYDFLNLSPYEFEILTRDLLQAEMSLFLESFGMGTDNGIDLRYAKGDQFIVQCKRYQNFDDLFNALKKEVKSVKKLAPARYILVTSVSMLPARKEKILQLFSPFILSTDDILGKDDLNNLLQTHPKVERDHFKLWLSSINILQTIVNRQIVNQSRFVLDEILEKLKLYVQNNSFLEARKILQDNQYVIISGIPGIGKTTLAEVLVYDALASGYEEFVHLSGSITEGLSMFEEGRSQVFFFDDFLGSNFLADSLNTNEEKQLLRFINRVKGSNNKLLIFTTREYILSQARLKFEELDNASLVKCILDLSKYTTLVKAQILYNHLFFKGIPYPFIEALIAKKYLPELVKHANYSPRIIEYICKETFWSTYKAKDFPDALLAMFKSPYKVWEHAFTQQITLEAQTVLYALLISGPEVVLNGLLAQYTALRKGAASVSNLQRNAVFRRALKELEGSFIQLTRQRNGDISVKFHNPSIQDFLINYCNQDEAIGEELIQRFVFIRPALTVFSDKYPKAKEEQRFVFSARLMDMLRDRLMRAFDELHYSPEAVSQTITADDLVCMKLGELDAKVSLVVGSAFEQFLISRFEPLIYSENIGHEGLHAFDQLLIRHFSDHPDLDVIRILLNIVPSFWGLDDFSILSDFEGSFPEKFQEFKEEYYDQYQDIFAGAIDDLSDDSLESKEELKQHIEALNELESYYDASVDDVRYRLEKAIEKIEEAERQSEYDDYHYYGGYRRRMPDLSGYWGFDKDAGPSRVGSSAYSRPRTEDEQIDDLFRSMGQDD